MHGEDAADRERNRRGVLGEAQLARLRKTVRWATFPWGRGAVIRADLDRGVVRAVPVDVVLAHHGGITTWVVRSADGGDHTIWMRRSPMPGPHTAYALPESGIVVGVDDEADDAPAAYARVLASLLPVQAA